MLHVVFLNRLRLIKIISVSILFLPFLGNAQYDDTSVYVVKLTMSGVINKTNVSTSYLANNLIKFSITKKRTIMNTYGSWAYGKQDSILTNNDFNLSTDVSVTGDHDFFYVWAFTAYDKSYSLKINNRSQTGVGIGFDLLKSTVVSLNLSDGFVYEYSDLIDASDQVAGNVVQQTFRNSFRMKYTLILKKIIIFQGSNYWQPSMDDRSNYIIKMNNSINVKLQKWVSFSVVNVYNKVSNTGKENFLLTYGLTFNRIF
jgi:hypothetical protein